MIRLEALGSRKLNNNQIGIKPGMGHCIHWLNPLLLKCGKQLCPV